MQLILQESVKVFFYNIHPAKDIQLSRTKEIRSVGLGFLNDKPINLEEN